jgi:hypothetical protein
MFPLFYQFEVRPTSRNNQVQDLAGAIATVMVFADSEEVGRARSSRYIALNHWEILEIKRIIRMSPSQLANLQSHFVHLYQKAEQFGIAAQFDGWVRHGRHAKRGLNLG